MSNRDRRPRRKVPGHEDGFPPPDEVASNVSEHPNLVRGLVWGWALIIGLLVATAIINRTGLMG